MISLTVNNNTLKSYVLTYLQVAEGIKPTLAELERFEDQPEGMEVDRILSKRL